MVAARAFVPYRRTWRALPRLGSLGCDCGARAAPTLGFLGDAPAPPADWQVRPGALNREVRRSRTVARLGALGVSTGASGAVEGGSTGAKAGSLVLPGIGTAIGAVVGAIAGYLLSARHYFNVGDSNSQCQQLMQAWQQYTTIQGHVAGRALGFSTMQQLFHAAVGAGLFPGNAMHLQFHEGTLMCAGHGDWADDFLGVNLQGNTVNNCGAHNCLPDALSKYNQSRGAVPPGTADAVFLVDSILLPMNQSASIPWIYQGAENPQVHQLLYDLADAYLAQNASNTTPYVEYPAAQTGTPTPGAVSTGPAASIPLAPAALTPAALPGTAIVPYQSPAAAAAAGLPAASTPTSAAVPTDQTSSLIQQMLAQGQSQQAAYSAALQSLAANGVNTQAPAVQQQVAGAVQAMAANPSGGLVSLTPTEWALLAGGAGVLLLLMSRRRAR